MASYWRVFSGMQYVRRITALLLQKNKIKQQQKDRAPGISSATYFLAVGPKK